MTANTRYPGTDHAKDPVRASDRPQYDHEGGRHQKDVEDSACEIDEQLYRQPAVLRDPRFGIVDGWRDRAGATIGLLEPSLDQIRRQPQPPTQLQAHPALQRRDRRDRGDRAEDRQLQDALNDSVRILGLKRVEKPLAPTIDGERDKRVHDETN